ICVAIGLFPILAFPMLQRVLATWPGFDGQRLADLVPHVLITTLGVSLIAAVAIAVALLRSYSVLRERAAPTWDCGYLQPRATMQYTSSSFASALVGLLRWVLRPQMHRRPAAGLFPKHASFESHVPDIVLDGVLVPSWRGIKSKLASLRVLQQGRVQR